MIPVIQSLLNRIVPRIRVLVVVPSRDLSIQVISFLIFKSFRQKIHLIVLFVEQIFVWEFWEELILLLITQMILHGFVYFINTPHVATDADVIKSCEKVDIAIATPGKLVEHIKNDPTFDIQDLQYLIVDEADKLLMQSYSNWIHVVFALFPFLFSYMENWMKPLNHASSE